MNYIDEIIEEKYNDEDFLDLLEDLNDHDLDLLYRRLHDIKDECSNKLKKASKEFRRTGIPANQIWWKSTKTVSEIRQKQIMMIRRERAIRRKTR